MNALEKALGATRKELKVAKTRIAQQDAERAEHVERCRTLQNQVTNLGNDMATLRRENQRLTQMLTGEKALRFENGQLRCKLLQLTHGTDSNEHESESAPAPRCRQILWQRSAACDQRKRQTR